MKTQTSLWIFVILATFQLITSFPMNTPVVGTSMGFEADCVGRKDGKYWHPWDCGKYIVCLNGQGRERSCPAGRNGRGPLRFDPNLAKCRDARKVPCALE